MCRYRINQHLMVLKLDRVSINKSLASESVTLKVSQYLNMMQNMSNGWGKTFGNKSIAKDHQIPNKWTDYKIFELKYGNTKLLGNTKHNQVKLVLAVFVSAICTNIALNYIKQTRYKYEKLGKYSPYCTRHRVITTANTSSQTAALIFYSCTKI